jgi:hypothetical protein
VVVAEGGTHQSSGCFSPSSGLVVSAAWVCGNSSVAVANWEHEEESEQEVADWWHGDGLEGGTKEMSPFALRKSTSGASFRGAKREQYRESCLFFSPLASHSNSFGVFGNPPILQ